jgi:hypothetical protein
MQFNPYAIFLSAQKYKKPKHPHKTLSYFFKLRFFIGILYSYNLFLNDLA